MTERFRTIRQVAIDDGGNPGLKAGNMKEHRYYIVDVFGIEKYSGNQLAVVLPQGEITDRDMQAIANEFHFSETTFVMSGRQPNGGYDVRIFTPREEVPFAGHPTLGTAHIINTFVEKKPADQVILNLKAGQIPVTFPSGGSGALWMRQLPPVFGGTYDPASAAEMIGVNTGDIDTRFPVQDVSTGLPFTIIPLKTLDAVRRAKPDQARQTGMVFLFCPETYAPENHLNARMFALPLDITEDPATGSANGCLAGYLVKYRYFGKEWIDVRVEQGYEINRKSILYLKAEETGGRIDIRVGGNVFLVAEGVLKP
jgi:trans-2,3-dihydro-3-hydroxyanthranilate isomerase